MKNRLPDSLEKMLRAFEDLTVPCETEDEIDARTKEILTSFALERRLTDKAQERILKAAESRRKKINPPSAAAP